MRGDLLAYLLILGKDQTSMLIMTGIDISTDCSSTMTNSEGYFDRSS